MSGGINTVSLNPVLKKLEESGFYWGAITGIKAKSLLQDQPVGTFLVRDSSDARHLFTVTLVTATGITNIRIIFCEGLFSLDKKDTLIRQSEEDFKQRSSPRFDCVVKMVFYYMLVSRKILQEKGQATPPKSDKTSTPIFLLWIPLYKEVSSLQHLCRRALNRQIITAGDKESIPYPVKYYLSQYPYPM